LPCMDYMKQALSLARLALGQVSPNPAVGAVIVKNNEVVGQGYTQPPGSDHAEVVALKQAGERAKGGVMYVTLEPCSHYGRTPPCIKAIMKAGIREVHVATLDDNPLVAGGGMKELKKAGIKVVTGENEQESRQLNEAYFKYMNTGMPFVTAKYAMSLDGKIATRSGDSKWISNEESRHFSHYIRYTSDAIMVGVNTVLIDDPHLTARIGCGRGGISKKQPLRVELDDAGRTPLSSHIFHEPGQTLLVLGRSAEESEKEAFIKTGARLVEMPSKDGMIDLKKLLKYLAELGIMNILVEGGGTLLGSLFDQGLVDKVFAFIAPVVIGGSEAKTPVAGLGVEKVAAATKIGRVSVTTFGQDVMISGYVVKE